MAREDEGVGSLSTMDPAKERVILLIILISAEGRGAGCFGLLLFHG